MGGNKCDLLGRYLSLGDVASRATLYYETSSDKGRKSGGSDVFGNSEKETLIEICAPLKEHIANANRWLVPVRIESDARQRGNSAQILNAELVEIS